MSEKELEIYLRVAKNSNSYDYLVEQGSETSLTINTFRKVNSNRDFFGHCYHCGCHRHSQNYCPLKLCNICSKYGHDQRVCFFNPSRKI